MSVHAQDLSIYTGLNSSHQLMNNQAHATGFAQAMPQGATAPAMASTACHSAKHGPFVVLQNQTWGRQALPLPHAQSPSQPSSSDGQGQPTLSSNGPQAQPMGEPEAAEIVQYPKFLNSQKHP